MSASRVLQHLCSLDRSSPEFLRSLHTFIRLDEKGEYSLNLQQSESARLVEFLDAALNDIPVTDALFRRCHRRLRLICGHHHILPSSHIIREGLTKTSPNPVAFGGFADVWEGAHEGERVCVKALRLYNVNTENQTNALALFYGETVVWKRLRHPNIVGFLGVTTTPLQIVLEWMPGGTLTEYTSSHPKADRISLLLDVAEGVNYLHTCHMLHGDLKGPNILIDGQGHARVSDFGLSSIAYGKYSTGVRSDKGHTVRWSAPEVLFGTIPASKQADMFAFGMVVIEVFTGKVPFHDTISTAVSYKTMSGERPPRPNGAEMLGLTDALWKMTRLCWKEEPKDRLNAPEVVDILREMYVTSPSNPFAVIISGNKEEAVSNSTIPRTDSGLSPKLLSILQYRRSTHKRAEGATTLANDGEKTIACSVHGRRGSVMGHWQDPSGRPESSAELEFGGAKAGQISPHFAAQPLGSETSETAEDDAQQTVPDKIPPTKPPIPNRRSLNQVSVPGDGTCNSPKHRTDTQGEPVQAMDSNASSLTAVDGSTDQHPRDGRSGRGDSDARNVRGRENGSIVRKSFNTMGSQWVGPHGPGCEPVQDASVLVPDSGCDTAIPSPKLTQGTPSPGGRGGNGTPSGTLGPNSRNVKFTTTRPATHITERGENSRDKDRDGEPRLQNTTPQSTSGVKKGFGGWGRVRVMTKIVGLHKQVQSQHDDPSGK